MSRDACAYLFALAPVTAVGLSAVLATLGPSTVSLGVVRTAGLVPLVAGLGVVAWAVHTFARAGVTPSPAEASEKLVTDGPLAHTRNPLYLGTVLGASGVALLGSSPVAASYALSLAVVYHAVVVYREEPKLRAAHGAAYDRYRVSVSRWL